MQQLVNVYKNDFGLGFFWKKDQLILNDRIQIVFRDMGFYLTKEEIISFLNHVENAKKAPTCQSCTTQKCCKSILLKTPASKIDLAINGEELIFIEDLLRGILFHLSLQEYLKYFAAN